MVTTSAAVRFRYRIEVGTQFRCGCCRQGAIFKEEELVADVLVNCLRDTVLFQFIVNVLVDLRLKTELSHFLLIKRELFYVILFQKLLVLNED